MSTRTPSSPRGARTSRSVLAPLRLDDAISSFGRGSFDDLQFQKLAAAKDGAVLDRADRLQPQECQPAWHGVLRGDHLNLARLLLAREGHAAAANAPDAARRSQFGVD